MRNPISGIREWIRKRKEERAPVIGSIGRRVGLAADVQTYKQLYETHSIFRRAIDYIASEVVNTPYSIDGSKAEIEVVQNYLKKPNFALDNFTTFMFSIATSLLTYNFSCVQIVRGSDGTISELFVLNPLNVTVLADNYGHILSVKYQGQDIQDYLFQTLIPSQGPSVIGPSFTQALLSELAGLAASVNFFCNEQVTNGVPPGILVVKNLRGDSLERFTADLYSTIEDKQGNLKVVVLGGGMAPDDVKFVSLDAGARRSIEVDQVLASRVIDFFAIPTSEDPMYVWREKRNERFIRFVKPTLQAIESMINSFITNYLQLKAKFAFQIRNVVSLSADEVKVLVQTGVLSTNEMRELLGVASTKEDVRYIVAGRQVYTLEDNGDIIPVGGDNVESRNRKSK